MSVPPHEIRRPGGGTRAAETIAGSEVSSDCTAKDDSLAHFGAGYRLGFETGVDVGYARGVSDESAAWSSVLTGCTDMWRRPRHEAVLAAREVTHDPCPTRCDRCSRCIHSRAWWARGGRPFEGVDAEARLRDDWLTDHMREMSR